MGSMGEGLFAMDAEGLLTYLNPTAERLLGWKSEELLGRRIHDHIHNRRPDGSPFPPASAPSCACRKARRR